MASVFPVKLTVDGRELGAVKMFTDPAGTSFYIWDKTRQTGKLVLHVDAEAQRRNRSTWRVTDPESGESWLAVETEGCGCGNALKNWRPSRGAHREQAAVGRPGDAVTEYVRSGRTKRKWNPTPKVARR